MLLGDIALLVPSTDDDGDRQRHGHRRHADEDPDEECPSEGAIIKERIDDHPDHEGERAGNHRTP